MITEEEFCNHAVETVEDMYVSQRPHQELQKCLPDNLSYYFIIQEIYIKFYLYDQKKLWLILERDNMLDQIEADKFIFDVLEPPYPKFIHKERRRDYEVIHRQFVDFLEKVKKSIESLGKPKRNKQSFFELFGEKKYSKMIWEYFEGMISRGGPLDELRLIFVENPCRFNIPLAYLNQMSRKLTKEYEKLSFVRYERLQKKLEYDFFKNHPLNKKHSLKKWVGRKPKGEVLKLLYDLIKNDIQEEKFFVEDLSVEGFNKHYFLLSEIKRLRNIIKEKSEKELDLKVHLYEVKNKLQSMELKIFDIKRLVEEKIDLMNKKFKEFNEIILKKMSPSSGLDLQFNEHLAQYKDLGMIYDAEDQKDQMLSLNIREVDVKLEKLTSLVQKGFFPSKKTNMRLATGGAWSAYYNGFKSNWFKTTDLSRVSIESCCDCYNKEILRGKIIHSTPIEQLYLINTEKNLIEKLTTANFSASKNTRSHVMNIVESSRGQPCLKLLLVTPHIPLLEKDCPSKILNTKIVFNVIGRGLAFIGLQVFDVFIAGDLSIDHFGACPKCEERYYAHFLSCVLNQIMEPNLIQPKGIEINLEKLGMVEDTGSKGFEHQKVSYEVEVWTTLALDKNKVALKNIFNCFRVMTNKRARPVGNSVELQLVYRDTQTDLAEYLEGFPEFFY